MRSGRADDIYRRQQGKAKDDCKKWLMTCGKSDVRKWRKRWTTDPKPERRKEERRGGTGQRRTETRLHEPGLQRPVPRSPSYSMQEWAQVGGELTPHMRIGSPQALRRMTAGNDTNGRISRIARNEQRKRPLEWEMRRVATCLRVGGVRSTVGPHTSSRYRLVAEWRG